MNHSLVRRVKVAVSKNAAAALAVETAEAEVVAATVVETVAVRRNGHAGLLAQMR